jgi:hypothetical protein
MAVLSSQAVNERVEQGSAPLDRGPRERRRAELESGPGGDHNLPYRFSLPLALPQVLAWMTLMARVHRGEVEPEMMHVRNSRSHAEEETSFAA